MGMVVMSKRELNRLDVLARLDSDRLTARAAAELMAITPRQTYRLLRRYRDGGASAIANQRRGRPSNNRLPDVVRDHAIALVWERYADFGPTFAAEKLAERHDLKVSRETLRGWMRQAGIWMSRAERKRIQQPRHRREHIGELVQIDGSEHRWFEDRAAACTLLVFVDDATTRGGVWRERTGIEQKQAAIPSRFPNTQRWRVSLSLVGPRLRFGCLLIAATMALSMPEKLTLRLKMM